jgi:glycolate oxidase iron-sulfur subunit
VCGAIDQHLSANDEALQKIKKNIDAWHSFEVIISSASGCGVMVKDYGSLKIDSTKPPSCCPCCIVQGE